MHGSTLDEATATSQPMYAWHRSQTSLKAPYFMDYLLPSGLLEKLQPKDRRSVRVLHPSTGINTQAPSEETKTAMLPFWSGIVNSGYWHGT